MTNHSHARFQNQFLPTELNVLTMTSIWHKMSNEKKTKNRQHNITVDNNTNRRTRYTHILNEKS